MNQSGILIEQLNNSTVFYSPLKDDDEYDGGFECSFLKVSEKKEQEEAKDENWLVNDPVSEEKHQYDHVRVIESNATDEKGVDSDVTEETKGDEDGEAEGGALRRRRRAAGLLPQVN